MELCCSSAMSSVKIKEAENTTGPNWLELPRDITAKILSNLSSIDLLLSARHVCLLWWNICKDPFTWRSIHMPPLDPKLLHIWHQPEMRYLEMCFLAIDQSRGHLQNIHIECFGSDYLLKYVVNSTGQLRRLRFRYCNISDEALRDVANKFPLLEELHISVKDLTAKTVEIIGRCCRHMTTLKLKLYDHEFPYQSSDDEAFAIAKNMPKLCHLDLSGSLLTSYGLCAILDGCNHLESVSLRHCVEVGLRECLGKRRGLRRLRLKGCRAILDVELREFVTKLPLLEELDIYLEGVSSTSLELIGRNCPNLTTLKFGKYSSWTPNDEAFAIAKAMPKLRHLHLSRIKLRNDVLLAILDGCSNLELLDLRHCYKVSLRGSLGERCRQQIKVLKLPHEKF